MIQSVAAIEVAVIEPSAPYASNVSRIQGEFLRLLDELRDEYDSLDEFLINSGAHENGMFLMDFEGEVSESFNFDTLLCFASKQEAKTECIILHDAVMALKGAYDLLEHSYTSSTKNDGVCDLTVFKEGIQAYFQNHASVISRSGFHNAIALSQTDNIMHIAQQIMKDTSKLQMEAKAA
ncbi:hypothetical protein LMH73_018200 [Vibrio splendidus]|nr:hypothetical protein [Vibrio splendidus]MCC4882947.1 hypothetical protein [Vibrio splendidus]